MKETSMRALLVAVGGGVGGSAVVEGDGLEAAGGWREAVIMRGDRLRVESEVKVGALAECVIGIVDCHAIEQAATDAVLIDGSGGH